ncbi:alkaline phosphatase family protein [bacterium]|nr:alkaline phosphatase family protein [bacterium]
MMKNLLKNNLIKNYMILVVFFSLLEISFRLISGISLNNIALLRIFIGVNFVSVLLSFILSWFNKLISKILVFLVSFALSAYTFFQIGFNNFIGVYASVNTKSQLGAVKDYIIDFFASFKATYYLAFIPFILLIIYYLFLDKLTEKKIDKRFPLKTNIMFEPGIRTITSILVLTFTGFLYYTSLDASFMQNKLQTISNKELFAYPSIASTTINQFGVLGFGFLDIKSTMVEAPSKVIYTAFENNGKDNSNTESKREIDDTILDEIIKNEKNTTLNNINNYIKNKDITDYNSHTGMFEGKNVIVIMMESTNDIIINKDLYPNFYKLYSEGISFKNNYSPRNSCATGNNEFSGMTGLYTIQNNCTANVFSNNTYFTSIFNIFKNAGYRATSMHDYTEQYYVRNIIHKNLGSEAYYNANDLNIKYYNEYKNWASDEDFMNAAMDITLNDTSDKPFMLWLTTVSGHQPYKVSSVEGDKYLSITEGTDYSMEVRRYMSKLKTFDNGLGILLDKLKASGKLDDTVIVMYGDHYPYGLKNKDISSVLTYDLDDYEVERVPMVIYNSTIKSEVVEKYSSYINLTPTLANLFNLDYDPRYYMGTDVFSDDYLNMVAFADGSWKNADVYYNASSGSIKYYTSNEYTTDELIRINNIVTNRMQISESIIRNNYFNYLENKINSYKSANDTNKEEN